MEPVGQNIDIRLRGIPENRIPIQIRTEFWRLHKLHVNGSSRLAVHKSACPHPGVQSARTDRAQGVS